MRLNIYKATLNDEPRILYARAVTVRRTRFGRKGLKVIINVTYHAYYFTSGIVPRFVQLAIRCFQVSNSLHSPRTLYIS